CTPPRTSADRTGIGRSRTGSSTAAPDPRLLHIPHDIVLQQKEESTRKGQVRGRSEAGFTRSEHSPPYASLTDMNTFHDASTPSEESDGHAPGDPFPVSTAPPWIEVVRARTHNL